MQQLDKENIRDILALSPMQEGMLYHYLEKPGSPYYFEQLSLEIEGEICLQRFERAWNFVVDANEMLRTVFRWEKLETPTQVILKKHTLDWRFEDLSGIEDSLEQKKQWETIKQQDGGRQFDLREVPFRIILGKMAQSRYHMLMSNHHILYDGWSTGIILKEFLQAYEVLAVGNQPLVPLVKTGTKEFIQWHRKQDREEQKKYWQNYLEGFDTPSRLPVKRSRQSPDSPGEKNYRLRLSHTITDQLEVFVKDRRITLAAVFYCAWGVLLQKYCDMEDVVFGITVSGRSAPIRGIENMVGLFINTLPLRAGSEPGESWVDFLLRINNHLAVGEKYENTSLVDLYSYCRQFTPTGEELFDTLVSLENYPLDTYLRGPGSHLSIRSYAMEERPHYDLTLVISAIEGIEIDFIYKNTSFAKETIVRLAHHFSAILKGIGENVENRPREIEILSEQERQQLLVDFNRTAANYPKEKIIYELFAEQAERTPDNIAVIGEMQSAECKAPCAMRHALTYRELNEKAGQLASKLIEKGVKPDTIVGIMMERSVDMVMGILGILKSGGAYMPIDPGYPPERIDYMLKDSGAKLVVNQKFFGGSRGAVFQKSPPGRRRHYISAKQAVYIIYTSGSTGRPKGVMVEQSPVVNLLWAMQRRYPLTDKDTYLLKTSYLFDVSVTELLGWFLQGGRLAVLEPGGEKDPKAILEMIARQGVTHINFVPSMFQAFVEILEPGDIAQLAGLKYIFLAGEALPAGPVKRFRSLNTSIAIENIYGPTEAAVYAGWFSLAEWDGESSIPIGKPLPNVKLYIIDKWGNLQPIAVPGELCISGAGLARGYLNNPELTAQSFRFYRSYRSYKSYILYKSGDLARWHSDGNIEFLGRMDSQVKIRGFRIELGEIESRLTKHAGIKEAVVVVHQQEKGDKYICAYFVSDREYTTPELREYLHKELPGYMIPSYFTRLEKIPLTPNGKILRKALPEPELKSVVIYIAPGDEIEKKLAEIWSGVLGIEKEKIGINDNFFHLGGHSLKATILAARIHKELKVNVPLSKIFKTSHIRGLAEFIKNSETQRFFSIGAVEKKQYYILSSAQRRLLVLQQMDENAVAYNIPSVWQLEGNLDREKFAAVFQQLIQRHESLRTSFHMVNEEPVQRIEKETVIGHWSLVIGEVGESEIEDRIKNFIKPFDLSQAPLLRVGLIEFPHTPTALRDHPSQEGKEDKYLLMVDMHHIISDGMSMGILVREFMELYAGKGLPVLRLQYKDYSEWQKKQALEKSLNQQEAYWLREFPGDIPVLDLPIDYPRPLVQDFSGSSISFEIGGEETNALKSLANEQGVTQFMLLLSLYTVCLSRLSGQEDIVVGTPIAGRLHADIEPIMGMFVNTLPLRNFPAGGKPFILFLQEVKENTVKAFENQDYLYEDLVEKVDLERDSSRNPLFDTLFTLQNFNALKIKIPGLKIQPIDYEAHISKFDLALTAVERGESLLFIFEYCTKLFKEETLRRFTGFYKKTVSFVLENYKTRISGIDIISGEEKKRILLDFNDTSAEYPRDKTIHQLFAEQANDIPDHIAVIGQSPGAIDELRPHESCLRLLPLQITYNELNQKSCQLAHLLIEKGAKPGIIVGIMLERSIEMVIGILGILQAGGAYLPIDPDYPEERIDFMLKDSGVEILLKDNDFTPRAFNNRPKGTPSHLRLPPLVNAPATSLAYVMYTSGTTGGPKGVLVTQRNVVRLVKNTNYIQLTEKTRILQTGAPVFDATTLEIWGSLLNGGQLLLTGKETILDARQLGKALDRFDINTLWLSASLFNQLLDDDVHIFSSLDYLLVGGDVLSSSHINRMRTVSPGLTVINGYGPTENTTFSTTYHIRQEFNGSIPIGKPIANSTAYVVDGSDHLQPIGVSGELLVGGDGVSCGYMNNPELTGERFCLRRPGGSFRENRPLDPHKSFLLEDRRVPGKDYIDRNHRSYYHTGDLVRWLPDGNIEFLRRIDHQVKIRGFRVELGEIENQLLTHGKIKEAVVLARQDNNDKYLCAYIVAQSNETNPIEPPEIREYLSNRLPDYMIPSYFVPIEKIPLTPNGKIDRKALPKPVLKVGESYTAPRDEIEKKLVGLWSEILNVKKEKISINDNFFHLGGHSLKATILAARIHKELKVDVPLPEIFRTLHIRGLAAFIKKAGAQRFFSIGAVEKREYYILSSAQRRLLILQQMDENGVSYNIPSVWQLQGDIDVEKFTAVFQQLIHRHESLRTSFHMVNDEPVQRIQEEVEVKVKEEEAPFGQVLDACGGREGEPVTALISSFIQPFDLSRAPLLRVELIKLLHTTGSSQEGKEDRYLLMVDMHHIISDGVSTGILVKEFIELYAGKRMPVLRVQYKDYCKWQKKQSLEKSFKQQETYWLKEFSGEIPVLELPGDYPRLPVQDFFGSSIAFKMDGEETNALKSFANEQGVTLFMLIFSLYTVCLSRLSGQEEIAVGTPIAGRRHADLQALLGMFVNTLVLRNFPLGPMPFTRFLQEVKESTVKAFENQDYLYEDLVEQVDLQRDAGRNPLFDTMFTWQNFDALKFEIPGLKVQSFDYETGISKFDLTLSAVEKEENLLFNFEYCTKLFKEETIRRFIGYFRKTVSVVLGCHDIRISGIEIIDEEEKRRILYDFNDTEADYPKDKTIHQLFEEQVENIPDRVALVGTKLQITNNKQSGAHQEDIDAFGGKTSPGDAPELPVPPVPLVRFVQLTYRQLNEQSNRLAEWLIEKGVQSDTIVGIMVERSLEMIIGIWGILKSGGAYMPIDPEYPRERIDYMLKDSGAEILLTGQEITGLYSPQAFIKSPKGTPAHLHLSPAPVASLVYIIYTSGSTGRPKGVMVKKEGFLNLLRWYIEEFGFEREDNNLLIAPVSFDLSQKNLFSPFLTGGRLTLALPGIPDYQELAAIIREELVTIINCAPSVFYPLLESNDNGDFTSLQSLRVIILGGEPILPDRLLPWVNSRSFYCEIINTYGPTECTDIAAYHRIPGETFILQKEIPIGKPIPNAKVYILDKYLQVLPVRIPGELCIGGIGFSRGYSNNIYLTREKFITAPHLPAKRVYRTGDLTRWLPDGNIQFLGRIDQQVKIRGYRIELEEIEGQLLKHEKIKEAVVTSRPGETGDNYLCAYFVPHMEQQLSASDLQEYLGQRLPDYMIPSYFVPLEKIPLSPNGKLDRRALPKPELKTGQIYTAPRNEIEKKLVDLWSEILAIEAMYASQLQTSIGIHDNFFRLGGHSLKATVMVSKIQKHFGVKIAIQTIFRFPTIAAVAGIIKSSQISGSEEIEKLPVQPYYEMSYAQKRLWYIYRSNPRNTAFNMPAKWTFFEPVDAEVSRKVLERLMIRHESLRTSFKEVKEGSVQVIEPQETALSKLNFDVLDLSQLDQAERENQRIRLLKEESSHIFNLEEGPHFRARLVKCSEEEYDIIINIHHIAADGWSLEVFKKEFLQVYESYVKKISCELEPLKIQYKDYAAWHNRLLNNEEKMGKAKEFWKNYLKDSITALNLPYDFSSQPLGTRKSSAYCFLIEEGLAERLHLLARERKVSLFIVLLAAFNILLSHISTQDNILVGIPAAARQHWSLKNIIGLFVNTLILQSKVNAKETFIDFLERFQTDAFNVLEYQDYPLEIIFGELKIKYPEISVFFNMVNIGSSFEERKKNFKSHHIEEVQETKFPIHCYLTEYKNGILMECHYFRQLFRPGTIEKIMEIYTRILENLSASPLKKIKELPKKVEKMPV